MSRIRSGNTSPEKTVRTLMHKMGYRFRLHEKKLPGTPDIVLPKYRTVVFVHGCFWHRHRNCKYAYMPKTKVKFWREKFNSNVIHDKRIRRELTRTGWRVIVIWECQIRNKEQVTRRIARLIPRR